MAWKQQGKKRWKTADPAGVNGLSHRHVFGPERCVATQVGRAGVVCKLAAWNRLRTFYTAGETA